MDEGWPTVDDVADELADELVDDLLDRARAGDAAAFRDVTEPHRRELLVHCYRMLGSHQDAEDALQETLLAAWRGFGGFAGRSSVRTWLYSIATNRCLNARRSASRRAAKAWDVPGVEPPHPTRLGEVVWLQPLPDAYLPGEPEALGPEARYEQTESISLAFVTALQLLPRRQVAVLLLRDVLGLRTAETAEMLGCTGDAVEGALKRARRALRQAGPTPDAPSPAAVEDALLARFVSAYEAADLDAVVALLTDDVFVSMPPMPFEYVGRESVAAFCASLFDAGRRFRLVATRANKQPAFGTYLRGLDAVDHGVGLLVLAVTGDRISAITRFESEVLGRFGLPRSLAASG